MNSNLQLIPLHDLKKLNDVWISEGGDPQFLVQSSSARPCNFIGWVCIELKMDFLEGFGTPELFWDNGEGFHEKNCIKLPFSANGISRQMAYFPKRVQSLRLDPASGRTSFTNIVIKIRSMSYVEAIFINSKPFFRKATSNPRLYINFIGNLFSLFLFRGVSGVNEVFKEFLNTGSAAQARQYLISQLHIIKYNRQIRASEIHQFKQGNRAVLKSPNKTQILVGLVEHFGDIIACEPVVRALREKFKCAEITWVVNNEYRSLIDANPMIDCVVAVDCLTDWIKIRSHSGADHVIDLHVNGRICQCCRVPLRKSYGDTEITGDNHLLHGNLLQAFSKSAGLDISNIKPNLYIPAVVKNEVDVFNLPNKFVAIHAKSNNDEKDWDARYWKRLVAYIIESGYDVIEVGLSSVVGSYGSGYHDFCGKTSLLQLAEILSRAALFIGVESGPGHMVNALGVPAIIIIGQLQGFKNYDPYSGAHENIKFARNLSGASRNLSFEMVREIVSETLNSFGEISNHEKLATLPVAHANNLAKEGSSNDIKLIAFYLPQYHPISVNDEAWGKGFTEWTNVGKSKSYYAGQYQPRLPGELGYYDLRLSIVLEQQADLAKSYGVNGFCYYYYWFNGLRLLNQPIDQMLLSKKPDMPFCFCWANENWTRRWDGMSKEIIVAQNHSLDDDRSFIRSLLASFSDERYIRINNKPLLLVYRTDLFPNPKLTAELWRSEVRKAGFEDLYLVRCESNDSVTDPSLIGFDASYEVPTFILPDQLKYDNLESLRVANEFKGRIFDYAKIVEYFSSRKDVPYKRFKDPMLAWDNTPRHKENSTIFHGATPELYQLWLQNSIKYTIEKFKPSERIVFINAWNEWAEGSYLEPDLIYGRSFLEATFRARNNLKL